MLDAVKREVLVRYLDVWVPAALARGRRACFAAHLAPDAALAALRALAEFADRLRGRRLSMVVLGCAPPLAERLDAAQAELGIPPELSVLPVAGGYEHLAAALTAAGAAGAPLLACVDTFGGSFTDFAAVSRGRPAELMLAVPHPAPVVDFPLVSTVELVAASSSELLVFATSSGKALEAFKDQLWAVDEYAGVRYRDPADPAGHLIDISLNPHPGPLRRELLAHLAQAGEQSVTELRTFALTEGKGWAILGLVPARSGSKGVPGKNVRPLAGRTLLDYTAAAAREFYRARAAW